MRVDYNLYEGRTLAGAIDLVMARGDVIVQRGAFVGAPGRGRFLKRAPFESGFGSRDSGAQSSVRDA